MVSFCIRCHQLSLRVEYNLTHDKFQQPRKICKSFREVGCHIQMNLRDQGLSYCKESAVTYNVSMVRCYALLHTHNDA